MRLERRAVVVRAVAVDMAERAEIEAAKRLNAIGRGLYHVARGVDFVVEHDEHALAARFRRPGDAQRVVEVHPGIAAERAGRALRTDQHYRPIDPQRQVEENAVSSSVAVPCGMTKPAMAGSSRAIRWISARSSSQSAGPIAVLPTWRKVTGTGCAASWVSGNRSSSASLVNFCPKSG